MKTTNQVFIIFLGDATDQLLQDIVNNKPLERKPKSDVKGVEACCKTLGLSFDHADFVNACKQEAIARGLFPAPPKAPEIKPIPNDPKAIFIPEDKLEPLEFAKPPVARIPLVSPQETKKKDISVNTGAHKLVAERLASMDNHTLIGCISVFIAFPATSKDVYIPGVLMREWEEICWDEALTRNLDEQLEEIELKIKLAKEEKELEEVA